MNFPVHVSAHRLAFPINSAAIFRYLLTKSEQNERITIFFAFREESKKVFVGNIFGTDMKVLIVDDHPLFREGLHFILSDLADGLEFDNAAGVKSISAASLKTADLILLDLQTVDSKGLESLHYVRHREPVGSVVVISSDDDPYLIRECIENGAAGFIPKTSEPKVLVAALRLILAGGLYLPPQAAMEGSNGPAHNKSATSDRHGGLTKRQLHAVLLVAKGMANKNIADIMGITEGTVKLHLSAAFKTLNVKNRTEAVYAISKMGIKTSDIESDSLTLQ